MTEMVPHSPIGLETSVVFIQFPTAFETVPKISMGVGLAELIRSSYECLAVNASEMVNNRAKIR